MLKYFIISVFVLFQYSQLFSQISIVQDEINPERNTIVIFRNDEDTTKYILDNNEYATISQNQNYACIKNSSNKNDSIAIFTIYNKKGIIENIFNGPNLDKFIISNEKLIAIYGSYFSNEIMTPTRIIILTSSGKIKFSSKEAGFGTICRFTSDSQNTILFYDSLSYDIINKLYKLIILDNNYNIIGEFKIFVNLENNILEFIDIDENNKIVHIKKYKRKTNLVNTLNISFNGEIINEE